jgi:polyhydroxybutyrate depolymerase
MTIAGALLLAGCLRTMPESGALAPGEHTFLLSDGERDRRVRVFVPSAAAETTAPLALVVALHGAFLDGDRMRDMSGWSDLAEREGFAVVYPEGRRAPWSIVRTWNARDCCLHAMYRQVDDVGYLLRVTDRVGALVPIDGARVYAAGFSNGAMMAHRLGIEAPERFAAVGAVAGSYGYEPPALELPVAVMMVAMRNDRRVPYDGLAEPLAGFRASLPMPAMAEAWARALGAALVAEATDQHGNTTRDYGEGLRAVRFVTLGSGDHSWPGGRRSWALGIRPNADYDATAGLWRFFEARQRRE